MAFPLNYQLVVDEKGVVSLNTAGEVLFHNSEEDRLVYVPYAQAKQHFNLEEEDQNPKESTPELKLWTSNTTRLFITLVKDHYDDFQSSIKKHVWQKIASKMSTANNVGLTWLQCDTKWKGLLKTYKEIKDSNNTSGKNRRSWPYFEQLNEFLFKKPEINPEATCSSYAGLNLRNSQQRKRTHSEASTSSHNAGEDEEETDVNKKENKDKYESNFSKKRGNKEKDDPVERRHKEKLDRMDRYLTILDQMVTAIKK